jgi:hypothetical protein
MRHLFCLVLLSRARRGARPRAQARGRGSAGVTIGAARSSAARDGWSWQQGGLTHTRTLTLMHAMALPLALAARAAWPMHGHTHEWAVAGMGTAWVDSAWQCEHLFVSSNYSTFSTWLTLPRSAARLCPGSSEGQGKQAHHTPHRGSRHPSLERLERGSSGTPPPFPSDEIGSSTGAVSTPVQG